jgi:flagellar FliL protein
MKNILLIVLGAIILAAGTGATTYFILINQLPAGTKMGQAAEGEAPSQKDNAAQIYHTLHPNFIVNFQNPNRARFLQVSVEVMTYSDEVIDQVKQHTAVIRNNLLMLFSSQDAQVLSTRDGKEELRLAVLQEIQNILEEQTGKPGVEQAYFTSFVMQ